MNYQVSSLLIADSNNLSSRDWLLGVADDTTILSLPLDASDNGLFVGNFVPPPPRPLFLDEGVTPDGLTTCDLCSWAWQNGNSYIMDTSLEPSSELGWVLTLVIVSLTSAILGAIVMIIVLHCKRSKNPSNINAGDQESTSPRNIQAALNRPPINTPDDKIVDIPIHHNYPCNQGNINGVWSWLSRRSSTPSRQLENPPMSFVENHYTHMEDPYNSVDDALYAELDVGSTVNKDDNNPAYQNSAYTDPDAPTSSAPSSAYYSDLSITTVPDRAYEVVGLSTMPVWDSASNNDTKKHAPTRLAVISETVNVPSDYV